MRKQKTDIWWRFLNQSTSPSVTTDSTQSSCSAWKQKISKVTPLTVTFRVTRKDSPFSFSGTKKFNTKMLLNPVNIISKKYALFPIICGVLSFSFLPITFPIISKIYKLFSINRFLYYSVQHACYCLFSILNPWLDKRFEFNTDYDCTYQTN